MVSSCGCCHMANDSINKVSEKKTIKAIAYAWFKSSICVNRPQMIIISTTLFDKMENENRLGPVSSNSS